MNGGVVTNRGGVSPGSGAVRFLIARRNRGTEELAAMRPGETAELTGPLGNAWGDFFPAIPGGEKKKTALIGGGIGIAPLLALSAELPRFSFDFYAGFKTRLGGGEEEHGLLGPALLNAKETIIAAEDGDEGRKGRIPDFLDPSLYQAVYACGPEPMLKAVTASCGLAGTPCFISMEKHMACGVGACLGCTVRTINGNRRCCAGGPIFRAGEIFFDE
jgi:NAD(P)H-flavin reductase